VRHDHFVNWILMNDNHDLFGLVGLHGAKKRTKIVTYNRWCHGRRQMVARPSPHYHPLTPIPRVSQNTMPSSESCDSDVPDSVSSVLFRERQCESTTKKSQSQCRRAANDIHGDDSSTSWPEMNNGRQQETGAHRTESEVISIWTACEAISLSNIFRMARSRS
jgi:hypothetical protein